MRRGSVVLASAAMCLVATACGGGDERAGAIRATASAQPATTTTTLAPAETSTTTSTAPPASTTTTVRPATTTTRPAPTSTTVGPTTTAPAPTTPTTRFPGDTRRAVGWDGYTVSGDGRALTFSYYSGPPPCSIEDGAQVEETSSAVRVTLYERDGSGGQPCIAIAVQKSATVNLASPLGSRRVVDGARS